MEDRLVSRPQNLKLLGPLHTRRGHLKLVWDVCSGKRPGTLGVPLTHCTRPPRNNSEVGWGPSSVATQGALRPTRGRRCLPSPSSSPPPRRRSAPRPASRTGWSVPKGPAQDMRAACRASVGRGCRDETQHSGATEGRQVTSVRSSPSRGRNACLQLLGQAPGS